MMTHLTIDDTYFEWHKEKTGKSLNRHFFLPIFHSLQGHPEFGKMWMKLIAQILIKELGFKTTTKDCCIYIKNVSDCYYAKLMIFAVPVLLNRMQKIYAI